jgi:lipid-A-disaccharide synthase
MLPERSHHDTPRVVKIALIAGEISGDRLGAGLMSQLRLVYPHIHFYGIGGPQMTAAGLNVWYSFELLSVMGISAVLKRLPALLRLRHQLVNRILQLQPDVLISIDAPDFTLGVAKRVHGGGIKTVHYVSPSIWAWRASRIRTIRQSVDVMLTLFPFEQALYQQQQVKAVCVGHPLADQIGMKVDSKVARAALQLMPNAPILAILPGSRRSEIQYNLPVMLQSVALLLNTKPQLQCVLPVAHEGLLPLIELLIAASPAPVKQAVRLLQGQSTLAMSACDVVLLTSGTASLEAMLLKRPMVVMYKWSAISHALISPWVKTPFVALPNILAGKKIVPEFVQSACQPEAITEALSLLFQGNRRALLQDLFDTLHQSLKRDADVQAAAAVWQLIAQDIKVLPTSPSEKVAETSLC